LTVTIGIDEAGRGPVLGPLVVGLVVWSSELEKEEIKIRDSKKLSPNLRLKARNFIEKKCMNITLSIPAWLISRSSLPLQILEAQVIASALHQLPGELPVYCDALGGGQTAHNWIKHAHPKRIFYFEPGADDRYPAVSAASIMAKTCRDECMENIKLTQGETGSGYPSDPKTKEWLKNHKATNKPWPPIVRTSWKTITRL